MSRHKDLALRLAVVAAFVLTLAAPLRWYAPRYDYWGRRTSTSRNSSAPFRISKRETG